MSFEIDYQCEGFLDWDEEEPCEYEGVAFAVGSKYDYEVVCPECGLVSEGAVVTWRDE